MTPKLEDIAAEASAFAKPPPESSTFQTPPVDLVRARVEARGKIVATAARAVWAFEAFLSENSRHTSGVDVASAMQAVAKEVGSGRFASLGYWSFAGEAPAAIISQYSKCVEAIATEGLPCSISIKADVVGFDRALLTALFEQARAGNVQIHFDSQGWDTAERTLALVEAARDLGTRVSASVTARWRRSVVDVERLISLGVPMRIVKGQGGDPTGRGVDPRGAFLDIVRQCAGRASHIGVATHDRRVAEPALDILKAAGTPCCLEQLPSLPRLDFVAERRGLPVMSYIGYGRFGLPYAITELVRRPAVIGWILRDFYERLRP